jgi:hypothetical protein
MPLVKPTSNLSRNKYCFSIKSINVFWDELPFSLVFYPLSPSIDGQHILPKRRCLPNYIVTVQKTALFMAFALRTSNLTTLILSSSLCSVFYPSQFPNPIPHLSICTHARTHTLHICRPSFPPA